MNNEQLSRCKAAWCFVNVLIDNNYHSLWPQTLVGPFGDKAFIWNMYVKWHPEKGQGSRLRRNVCPEHTEQIMAIWAEEMAAEIREQEATEKWLAQTNSSMEL